MPEPLLNVMKIMLLAGLYLFFVRVLWSVYNELRDPRSGSHATNAPQGEAATARSGRRATQRATTAAGAARAASPRSARAGATVAGAVGVTVGQLVTIEPLALAGRTWALGNEITIGRDQTCGVHIEDSYVSGVHARVFRVDGVFMVEDLASRNGTLLNGAPLPSSTATRLAPGARIQIGTCVLEFS